jgi:hypothetical protein
VSWDPVASARNVAQVLQNSGGKELVIQLQAAAEQYTWASNADRTVALYEQAVVARSRPTREDAASLAVLEHRMATLEERLADKEARYDELITALGEDGMSLVGPHGVLPHRLRRPLLAVAARPWLRTVILGPLRIPYRIAHALRRVRRR